MLSEKEKRVLAYCKPLIDQMWASRIVGIILGCDWKDSDLELKKYAENN